MEIEKDWEKQLNKIKGKVTPSKLSRAKMAVQYAGTMQWIMQKGVIAYEGSKAIGFVTWSTYGNRLGVIESVGKSPCEISSETISNLGLKLLYIAIKNIIKSRVLKIEIELGRASLRKYYNNLGFEIVKTGSLIGGDKLIGQMLASDAKNFLNKFKYLG